MQGGTYAPYPWKLAQSAFAYALSALEPTDSPADFLDKVYDRYSHFFQSGFLTSSDLERVRYIFAHMCVGPLGYTCAEWHHLPGSPLPSGFTRKGQLFVEAEATPSRFYTVQQPIGPQSASGGSYITFGNQGYVSYYVEVPTAGWYRLRLVAQTPNTDMNRVEAYSYDDTCGWRVITTDVNASWHWADSGQDVDMYLKAGTRQIWLATAFPPNNPPPPQRNFKLDAILLQPGSCPLGCLVPCSPVP